MRQTSDFRIYSVRHGAPHDLLHTAQTVGEAIRWMQSHPAPCLLITPKGYTITKGDTK